ncbi:MAG TPA: hypothetical protein ENJ95_20750 [Bacteroidetes bacterium]|nr:hypothetical protein [Bacteroidota bacterium]
MNRPIGIWVQSILSQVFDEPSRKVINSSGALIDFGQALKFVIVKIMTAHRCRLLMAHLAFPFFVIPFPFSLFLFPILFLVFLETNFVPFL